MEEGFWQTRWQRDQIGFHLNQVNPGLAAYWSRLAIPKGSKVFVPLCGKSVDMCWLADQGYSVLGIELIEKAVIDFFVEQNLTPVITQQGSFTQYSAGAITILCGDFFNLTAEDLVDYPVFYDRAALIALPSGLREQYAHHLSNIMPKPCKGLLLTMDYPQQQMKGPPFAVPPEQVEQLLGEAFTVECTEERDILEQEWRFKAVGITRMFDYVYCVRSRCLTN
ncbi:thiopurine S-methyltransferase [Denitrificimonas caeni]|uniref:thiopurine S-methyltransferase n=1 Tax=Denitrificimonas caeni TaxID=521720 RepID=UPI001963A985|nr:thiopurine S-methyltransferase [Denitrificimonas caeni]